MMSYQDDTQTKLSTWPVYSFFFHFVVFYWCSSTLVCLSPSPLLPSHPHLSCLTRPNLDLCMCPLYLFLKTVHHFPPFICPPCPLWLLTVCSSFQCLWLYFACLFVLLIRSHLKVRSYGICLSPPGLFHLA